MAILCPSLGFVTKIYSKDLTVGIIINNDKVNFKILNTLNKLLPHMLFLIRDEFKEEFPKARIRFKYFFFQRETITAKKAISKAIADTNVHLVFGPFSGHLINVGRDVIQSGGISFCVKS